MAARTYELLILLLRRGTTRYQHTCNHKNTYITYTLRPDQTFIVVIVVIVRCELWPRHFYALLLTYLSHHPAGIFSIADARLLSLITTGDYSCASLISLMARRDGADNRDARSSPPACVPDPGRHASLARRLPALFIVDQPSKPQHLAHLAQSALPISPCLSMPDR